MFRPALFVLLMLLASFVPGVRLASASSSRLSTVTAVSHGIRVSLQVPNQPHILHGLSVFTVTVQNVSHANRYMQDFPPDWGGPYSPHILMRNDRGALAYEEDLSSFLAPTPGSLSTNKVLHPGESITWQVRFVLQASNVQAVTLIADGYTAFSSNPGSPTLPPSAWAKNLWHLRSPWMHLSLRQEPAPRVAVRRTGARLHVTVRAPWPTSGPMLYMDSARCWTGPSTMTTNQDVPWKSASGTSFTAILAAHCPSKQPWHAVVGWPGHPVAFISYPDAAAIR